MISTGDLSQLIILLNILGVQTGGGGGGDVTKAEVQEFAFNFAPVTGADDAFIVNLDPPVASYTDNLIVSLSSGTLQNNTTSPTLQVNALAAIPITLWGGTSVAPGDIMTNSSYLLIYNDVTASFQLLNPSISTANTFAVQDNFYNTAFDSGAVNAYAVTLIPEPQGSFSEGFPIFMRVSPGNTNTGASTLTVNGVTDNLVLQNTVPLPAGSMLGNGSYWCLWSSNSNAWVLMNPEPVQTIVTLADESATLPDSFSLGSLTSGLLKIVVTAGIAAPATALNGSDYWAPGDVITLPGAPTTSLDAATKGYVDSVVAGLNPTEAVQGASTANLTGYTYSPGTAGVGATLTAGSNGAFIQDGITYTIGQRFLYKNDTTGSGAYNGIYDVTVVGDAGTAAVLTRSINYNTPASINGSGLIPVIAGTVNAGTGWLNTSTVVTVGVTPIVYVQFGQTAGVISPVNGGSGVSNSALSTVTINGAFPINWNLTASTDLTLPVSGTLATVGDISSTAVLLNPGADQTIVSHNLILETGEFHVGTAAGGGSQIIDIFAPTANMGVFQFLSADNAGNYIARLTHASLSASQTWTLPDESGTFALTSGTQTITGPLTINGLAAYTQLVTPESGAANGFLFQGASAGAFGMQAGIGTAAGGGGLTMFGQDHPTKAGWVSACLSSGVGAAYFTVNNTGWLGAGMDVFTVDNAGQVVVGNPLVAAAGRITINPITASMGTLQITAVDSAGEFDGILQNESLSAARTWTLPDATGTLALSSQLGDFAFVGDTMSTVTTNASMQFQANGTGRYGFGVLPVDTVNLFGLMQVLTNTTTQGITVGSWINNASNSTFNMYKSRGTGTTSHGAVQANDPLGVLNWFGDDGTNYKQAANITVKAVGTISAGVVPTTMSFLTTTAAGALTQALLLDQLQQATFASQIFAPNGYITSGSAAGGFAGNFAMFSPTAAKGTFQLLCNDSASNFNGILENASMTASRTWVLPDASGTVALLGSSGALIPVSVSGTTQALASGSVYMFNNAAATTGTLPASPAIGDVIKIKGRSSAPWIIQANTGQIITDGSVSSSTAGAATSNAGTDSIQFTYVAANEWSVDWSLSANITLS